MSSSSDNPDTVTDRSLFSSSGKSGDRSDDDGKEEEGPIDKFKKFIEKLVDEIIKAIGVGSMKEKMEDPEALDVGKPSANFTGIQYTYIGPDHADLIIDVLIKNPKPEPVQLVKIDDLIDIDGRKLEPELIPRTCTIRAHGEQTVKIDISLNRSTYGEIGPGSIIPFLVRIVLLVDVPDLGYGRVKNLEIPLEISDDFRMSDKPEKDVDRIDVNTPSGNMKLSIDNVSGTAKLKKDDNDEQ